jgi:hypothetical protein
VRDIFQSKIAAGNNIVMTDSDIEDAVALSLQNEASSQNMDDMMVDAIEEHEQQELEAMISAYGEAPQQQEQPETPRSHSPSFSEGDEFDNLFMELLSRGNGPQDSSDSMDTC